VWTSGGLPVRALEDTRSLVDVVDVTEVRGTELRLTAEHDAEGRSRLSLPPGDAIPIDALAIDAAGYARFGAEAAGVAAKLSEAGVRLSYHNHSFEFERFGSKSGLELLFEASGPALGAQLDTYWIQHGGGSPASWIRRLRGRVPSVHLKDMVIVDGEPAMAEIGDGNLDWTDVLHACGEAGSELLVVEQDVCRRDPFESLAISRRNLATLGAT